jgi:hypothetical protein
MILDLFSTTSWENVAAEKGTFNTYHGGKKKVHDMSPQKKEQLSS